MHPLMVVFGVSYALLLLWFRRGRPAIAGVGMLAALFPFGMFPPPTDAYRSIIETHFYFFPAEMGVV